MKGTYRKKIFLTYSSLLLVFISVISGGFIFFNGKIANEESKHAIQKLISSQAQQLDVQMDIIYTSLNNIRTSEIIELWAYSEEKDYYFNSFNVQKELKKNLLKLSGFRYTIGVSYSGEEYSVINPVSSLSKTSYFLDVMGLEESAGTNMISRLKKMKGFNKSLVLEGRTEEGRTVNYAILQNFGDREILFFITIDEMSFYSSLAGSDDLWLIAGRNRIISVRPVTGVRTEDYYGEMDLPSPAEISPVPIMYKGTRAYMVSSRVSPLLNYICLYKQDSGISGYYLIRFLLPFILLIAGSLWLAGKITSTLYRPVSRVVNVFSENWGAGGFLDEFEFINSAAEEIQEDNRQLQAIIRKNRNLLLEKFHKDLLFGINVSKIESYKDFPVPRGQFKVVLFNLDDEEDNLQSDMIFLVKNTFRSYTSDNDFINFVNMDNNRFVLIFKGEYFDKTEQSVMKLISEIEGEYDIVIKASIGSAVEDFRKINESFNQADKIMEFRDFVGIKQILTKEDLRTFRDAAYYFPLNTETRLINCILDGNREETAKILNLLIDENMTSRQLTRERKRNFLFSLISSVNRIQQETKLADLQIFENEMTYVTDILSLEKDDQIRKKIHELFDRILDAVSSTRNNSNQYMAEEIMKYIRKNYSRDISLYDISQYLNITEKYSSILFKRVTGSNFKDVLNKHRIEKAKEILERDRDTRIQDLAGKVGFNSSNTFIRVFKKYVGVSPGAYADNLPPH